ncbi:MAG: hypothetical protein WCJ33_08475, partial [Pseudomonadota bacterium]
MSAKIFEECDLCCEDITKKNKRILCHNDACKKILCNSCFNKNILGNCLTPVCIWCKKNISFPCVVKNISEAQLKVFMDKRSDLFLERERSRLPYLQEEAEAILRERKFASVYYKFRKQTCDTLNYEFSSIKRKLGELYSRLNQKGSSYYTQILAKVNCINMDYSDILKRFDESCYICDTQDTKIHKYTCTYCAKITCEVCTELFIKVNDRNCFYCESECEEIKMPKQKKRRIDNDLTQLKTDIYATVIEKIELNKKYVDICRELYSIQHGSPYVYASDLNGLIGFDGLNPSTVNIQKNNESQRKQFIKKCLDDTCRGFLSSQWKCGICECNFCVDCHGKKDRGHVCNEDEKATITALKIESKPCPKCGMPISRISGCSQVWTPCCKIAFDWNTGEIDEGRIHSPEYYAYIQRTIGSVFRERGDVPCGEVAQIDLHNAIHFKFHSDVFKFYRLKVHVNLVTLRRLPREIDEISHRDLGIKYLTSDITEESWRTNVARREKNKDKHSHIYHILQTFLTVMNELFLNLIHEVEDKINI